MRISDWSSDVCSSDLSSGGVGAGASVVQSRGVGERGCIIVLRGRLVASLARPQGGLPQIARSSSLVGGHPVADPFDQADRKSVVEGKSVSVRVDLGGRRIIKKTKNKRKQKNYI